MGEVIHTRSPAAQRALSRLSHVASPTPSTMVDMTIASSVITVPIEPQDIINAVRQAVRTFKLHEAGTSRWSNGPPTPHGVDVTIIMKHLFANISPLMSTTLPVLNITHRNNNNVQTTLPSSSDTFLASPCRPNFKHSHDAGLQT